MNWLVLSMALQLGMYSGSVALQDSITGQSLYWETPKNTIEATMEFKATLLDHFQVSTFITSYQTPFTGSPSTGDFSVVFNPFRVDYGFEAKLVWGPFSAGVKHECDHQVSQIGVVSPVSVSYGAAHTEFFIRVDAKVKAF